MSTCVFLSFFIIRYRYFISECFYKIFNLHITRSEIMSPLTHTMSFIYGYKSDFYLGDDIQKFLIMETFWGDVDKFNREFAWISDFFQDIALLLEGDSRIDANRRNSFFSKFINLIFHERNERRNNNGYAIQSDSRNLIRETFPATRWHKYHRIVARKYALYNLFLTFTKGIETESFFEDGLNRNGHEKSEIE